MCEEFFMLDGRPHSQVDVETEFGVVSLILLVSKFNFDKIIFSIFQISRDHERYLIASFQDFTLCGILLERLFSCNSESITAAL